MEERIRERVIEERNYPVSRNWEVERVDIEALSVYSVYYGKDGEKRTLYAKNPKESLPIASISKLITAYTVFENYDLSKIIEITEKEMVTNPRLDNLRIWPGETTYRDLFYSLLIESNNSTAYTLATAHPEMNFDSFVSKMNETASKMGMEETHFINPSGLDSLERANLSTAYDLHQMALFLMDYPLFWEIMSLPSFRLYSENRRVYYEIYNTNLFLYNSYFNQIPDWREDMVGGKTGRTHRAGECLLLVLETEDGYIVNVILGSQDRFREMERLNNWIYKAYNL